MNIAKTLFAALAFAVLPGCAKLTLAWADLATKGEEAAAPPVLDAFNGAGPVTTVDEWERLRAPALREALEEFVYGHFPDSSSLTVISRTVLDEAAFDGAGRLLEYKLQGAARFGESINETKPFYMDVIMPVGDKNAPIILVQTFCPRWDTIPHPAIYRPEGAGECSGGGIGNSIMTYVFGRYIATPPIEMILERGYGIATIFPGEFAPDRRDEGLAALAELSAGMAPGEQRWGTIAAWAWGFSLMVDALEQDDEVSGRKYITWGHSRYGKSALLAAAFDDRIDGVIAHQSGTGGASLNRRKKGESVRAITESYPHWFAERYGEYAGREEDLPVDQHQLLALIAPRPVLLGNARRDVWSDPNGAFRAAVGADPVYELYGSEGLEQDRLDQWRPEAALAFWIRPGTHGVVKEDWPAFLEFLDAHFKR
jgi:(4-O-methyl)-D-glucuronate---lignin esterase